MNKDELFGFLQKQTKDQLLKILNSAFVSMNTGQRNAVFGKYEKKFPKKKIGGKPLLLLSRIQQPPRNTRRQFIPLFKEIPTSHFQTKSIQRR